MNKMELKLNIDINELIGLIKQLPPEKKLLIKKEVDEHIKPTKNVHDLTEFLMSGPTITEQEEENVKNLNKEFKKWTKSLSASTLQY